MLIIMLISNVTECKNIPMETKQRIQTVEESLENDKKNIFINFLSFIPQEQLSAATS